MLSKSVGMASKVEEDDSSSGSWRGEMEEYFGNRSKRLRSHSAFSSQAAGCPLQDNAPVNQIDLGIVRFRVKGKDESKHSRLNTFQCFPGGKGRSAEEEKRTFHSARPL